MIAIKIIAMGLGCFFLGFLVGFFMVAIFSVSSKCARDEEKEIARKMLEGKL